MDDKIESPLVTDQNVLSMASCIGAKILKLTFTEVREMLTKPHADLLRNVWFPVATTALEHFNFIQRPKPLLDDQQIKDGMDLMYETACRVAHQGRRDGLKKQRIIDNILITLNDMNRLKGPGV